MDTESELDTLFNDIFEIEGLHNVKELSRQLQTFFNYKAETIQLISQTNIRHNHFSDMNCTSKTFYAQKQKFESLSHEFISLLRSIKRDDTNLEQEMFCLHFDKNPTKFNKLTKISEQMSNLIHYFSERNIHNHPRFLNFIVVLVKNINFVKKCLNANLYEF